MSRHALLLQPLQFILPLEILVLMGVDSTFLAPGLHCRIHFRCPITCDIEHCLNGIYVGLVRD